MVVHIGFEWVGYFASSSFLGNICLLIFTSNRHNHSMSLCLDYEAPFSPDDGTCALCSDHDAGLKLSNVVLAYDFEMMPLCKRHPTWVDLCRFTCYTGIGEPENSSRRAPF